jgi:hypothetical protein
LASAVVAPATTARVPDEQWGVSDLVVKRLHAFGPPGLGATLADKVPGTLGVRRRNNGLAFCAGGQMDVARCHPPDVVTGKAGDVDAGAQLTWHARNLVIQRVGIVRHARTRRRRLAASSR